MTSLATAGSPLANHPVHAYARPKSEGAPLGTVRRLGKDEELFAEGDRAACFYKVVSGALRTYKLLDDGRRQIAAFHLPGDIFGLELAEKRCSSPPPTATYRARSSPR